MNVQVLPSAMQSRMAALKAAETPPQNDEQGNEQNEQLSAENTAANEQQSADNTQINTEQGERVTLSREEYNELKANSGRMDTVQGREAAAQLELEELRHRLTELQNSNKGNSSASESAPAPVIDSSGIQFTEEEVESFGESREFIEKVVDIRVAAQLNKLVPELRSAIEDAKKTAASVAGEVDRTVQDTFLERLTAKVPQLREYVKHPQWSAFLDEQDSISGFTYEQILSSHVNGRKLQQAANVYELFASKYVKPLPNNAAYAGATPGGGGSDSHTGSGEGGKKLKFSDRKKAGEDYRMGRITYEQLQEVNEKFHAADKAGNIDYNS